MCPRLLVVSGLVVMLLPLPAAASATPTPLGADIPPARALLERVVLEG